MSINQDDGLGFQRHALVSLTQMGELGGQLDVL